MEQARELATPLVGHALPYSAERSELAGRLPEAVILQVDGTVSAIDGLAWLTSRRDSDMGRRLGTLQREASEQGWNWATLTRTRLKHLRPRRAEINELGAAYLATLAPGVADAVSALRRAGIAIALASDVAAEGLFGVATALGVSPGELRAPRLRFDAIGAYVGCEFGGALGDEANETDGRGGSASPRTMYVGTRRSEMFPLRVADSFVAFTGVVVREGPSDAHATVATFHDLAALVLR